MEGQNRSEVSVEDDASHKSLVAFWKEQNTCWGSNSYDCTLVDLKKNSVRFVSFVNVLPVCSRDRASLDTEIFSSDVLTQSNMPLQPFAGKVKLELVEVGRLWMLSTDIERERERKQHLEITSILWIVWIQWAKNFFFLLPASCVWPDWSFPTKSCECLLTAPKWH